MPNIRKLESFRDGSSKLFYVIAVLPIIELTDTPCDACKKGFIALIDLNVHSEDGAVYTYHTACCNTCYDWFPVNNEHNSVWFLKDR